MCVELDDQNDRPTASKSPMFSGYRAERLEDPAVKAGYDAAVAEELATLRGAVERVQALVTHARVMRSEMLTVSEVKRALDGGKR